MDDEARELLAGFSRAQSPGAPRQAQAWEAIQGRIAIGDVGPLGSEGASSAGVWGKVALAVLVGGAVVLALLGVGTSGGDSPNTADPMLSRIVMPSADPQPEAVEPTQVPDPGAAPVRLEVPSAESPAPVAAKRSPPRPKQVAAATPPTSPPVPPASSLAEEMKLLRRASTQLETKAFSKALATLAEHKRRFPRGALSAERQIRTAEVHCKRGAPKAARRVVEAFLRAHPQTTLRTRALGICRAEAEGTP
ncbi:MAG: outer membrane protein assembly factor BamD [Nannocystales bacterium]